MILLILSLFLQYYLLQCVEFEKVDLNGLLRAHKQNSSLRRNTPAAFKLNPITPEYAFFTPPNDFHLTPTLEEYPHQMKRSQNIHDSRNSISSIYFKNIFLRHRSQPKKRKRPTVLDISEKSEETLEESQEEASSYNSREDDTSERSSSESELNGLAYNTVWHISGNSYPRSKEKTADDSESSREPEVHTTRRPKTVSPAKLRTKRTEEITRNKWKLKPDRLLPMTIKDDRNPDNNADSKKVSTPKSKQEWNFDGNDVLKRKKPHKEKHEGIFGDDKDIFKMMRLRKKKVQKLLRMHFIKTKHTKTFTPRQSLGHDRMPDDDAALFKKPTPPKSKHEWNFDDGNDMLMSKNPHKDDHEGFLGDDNDIFKMMKQKKDTKKNVARMHRISDTTKKMWYSDQMIPEPEEKTEHTKSTIPVTTRESLRQTPNDDWSRYDESNQEEDTTVSTTTKHRYASSSIEYLRAPLSKNYFFKIMEHRREGYMIVFLIELMQIIATKDRLSAHDIVKHADPIIHGQSKQLHWMGQPFLDVTRKFATMLKVTDISSIQAQAANVYHQLLKRHDTLPVVVNTILEFAETMYDDDEGKILFDGLRDLVSFPNIALSGYWLCNSLINAFLRPFRRLKNTEQLKELMSSINMALKKQDPLRSGQKQPLHSGRGFGAQAGGAAVDNQPSAQKKKPFIQTGPQIIKPRPLWKRKSKHHHRHHKRKRDDKQLLLRQWDTQRNQILTLTTVTPRTTVRLRLRDTTYAAYLMV